MTTFKFRRLNDNLFAYITKSEGKLLLTEQYISKETIRKMCPWGPALAYCMDSHKKITVLGQSLVKQALVTIS